jgi:outer membrane immunogenic protein
MITENSLIKKTLLAASASPAALAVASAAHAAPPVPWGASATVPAFSWTGCYVGANVGYGWGSQHPSQSATISASCGGVTSAAGAGRLDSSGGLLGAQVGCNFQFAPQWVAGVETDFDSAWLRGSGADFLGGGTLGVKTHWMASVTGHLGVTFWNNQLLVYVKGGPAWDENEWSAVNPNFSFDENFSEQRMGWVGGGGIAWAMTPAWIVFVEFDHYDFGNGNTFTFSNGSASNSVSTGKQTIDAIMIGTDFKIGP